MSPPFDLAVWWWKVKNPGPEHPPEEALLLGFVVLLSLTGPRLGDLLADGVRRAAAAGRPS